MLFLHTLFIFTLYRAPVDTSPVTEEVTLFKHRLLLLSELWAPGGRQFFLEVM